MGKILDEYFETIEKYKEVIPKEVYDVMLDSRNSHCAVATPTTEDRHRYFIDGCECLSQSIFTFLSSNRGPYIMGYVSEFNINRVSAGFKSIEDLVHFSVWVIERYGRYKQQDIEEWDNLRSLDLGKSDNELLKQVLFAAKIQEDLYKVTFEMRTQEDLNKRLSLIEAMNQNKSLAFNLLDSHQFYEQLDDIYVALSNIDNVYQLNVAPKPLKQTEWDLRSV